jgi:hypothetical protein
VKERNIRIGLLVILVLCLTGCATYSKSELAALKAKVTAKRATLSTLANPYRLGSQDLSAELDGTPLNDLLTDFNNLTWKQRVITIESVGTSGHLVYHKWFDCPWGGHASWFIDLAAPWALAAAVELGTFNSHWGAGFDFGIHARALAGGAALGYIDNCIWQTPVTGLVFAGYTDEQFSGQLTPRVDQSGAAFIFKVTNPGNITVYVAAGLPGVGVIPFWLNFDPIKDLGVVELDNIVGKTGELRNDLTKRCRPYSLDMTAKDARVLPYGIGADESVAFTWGQETPCQ